jgi:hypothetical protein
MFCPHCGKEVFNDAVVCIGCGRALPKPVPTNLETGAQKLRQVARTYLIIGILNLIVGIFVTALGWFLGIFSIALGIWELINANLLWSTPPKINHNRTYIATLEIINVICGPLWSLLAGISNLKRLRSPEVEAYFASLEGQAPQELQKRQKPRGKVLLVFGWIIASIAGLFLFIVTLAYIFPTPDQVRTSKQMPVGGLIFSDIFLGLLLLLAVWMIKRAKKRLQNLIHTSSTTVS